MKWPLTNWHAVKINQLINLDNGDIDEIVITMLHSFVNRSVSIIMDYCHCRNSIGLLSCYISVSVLSLSLSHTHTHTLSLSFSPSLSLSLTRSLSLSLLLSLSHSLSLFTYIYIYIYICNYGGIRSVIVTVVGNKHGDPSSNTGQGSLPFT